QDRHQIGNHDDAEQRVAEACAARQVGCPIAGVHVPDRHQVPWPGKGQHLSPEPGAVRDRDGPVDLGQADATRLKPPGCNTHCLIFPTRSHDFDYSKITTTHYSRPLGSHEPLWSPTPATSVLFFGLNQSDVSPGMWSETSGASTSATGCAVGGA